MGYCGCQDFPVAISPSYQERRKSWYKGRSFALEIAAGSRQPWNPTPSGRIVSGRRRSTRIADPCARRAANSRRKLTSSPVIDASGGNPRGHRPGCRNRRRSGMAIRQRASSPPWTMNYSGEVLSTRQLSRRSPQAIQHSGPFGRVWRSLYRNPSKPLPVQSM